LLGAAFAMSRLTNQSATKLLLLAAGNSLLVAHVFLLNDWSGIHQDLRDPSRSAGIFLNRGIRRNEIGALLLILLVLSLMALSRLGPATLVIGLMIAVASALYSVPHVYMKGIPLANSLLHVFSGLLHFLLGYSVFQSPDVKGLEIGLFFAAIFSAGHLTQEIRDCEADFRNGIRTNAVKFGKKRSLIASFALFTFANALLLVLAMRGTVPQGLALVVALYPLHFFWTLQAMREGLSFESVRRLQVRYRALYAGIGVAMVISVFLT
jgi:4-hydroxybenzoate polyprenyltransferase